MQNFIKLNIHKEIRSYLLGFVFSIVLTTIPFVLVIKNFFSSEINHIIFLFCAVTQIIIHFVYFLHLNWSEKERWNLITLLFVIVIIFIVVLGSIWIMSNLNHHVM